MRVKVLALICVSLLLSSCEMATRMQQKKKRIEFVSVHPPLTSEIREAILNGEVLLGMDVRQVLASRGRPLDINRSTGSYGVHEQWVYVGVEINARMQASRKEMLLDHRYAYIYFENEIVVSWQSR